MHRKIKVSLLIFIVSVIFTLATGISQSNSWKSIGPDGGDIEMVVTAPSDSNVVYAAIHSGSIFRSNDAGKNWIFVRYFEGSLFAIAVHPFDANIVYAGFYPETYGNDALFKSTDGGNTWTPTGWDSGGIRHITIDPQNPQIIYVFSIGSTEISKTEDGGETWRAFPLPGRDGSVSALVVNPLSSNIVYVAANNWKFYRSSDYGETWELSMKISEEIFGFPHCMDVNPSNPEIIYLATSAGLFKSTDGGNNWVERNGFNINPQQPQTSWVFVDPTNPQRVYRSSYPSLFISNNGGDTWELTNMPGGSITMAGNNQLIVGTSDGVYTSNENGQNVQFSSSGLHGTDIISLQVASGDDPKIYAATLDRLYISDIDSIHWKKQYFGGYISEVKLHPTNPEIIAVGFEHGKTSIKLSLDGGNSWAELHPDDSILSLEFSLQDSLTIYAGGYTTLFRSDDLGNTWEETGLPSEYYYINDIALTRNNNMILLSATTGFDYSERNVLLRSLDDGQTWIEDPIKAKSVFISPDYPNVILAATHDQLFRSEDFGSNWQIIQFSSQDASISAFQSLRDNLHDRNDVAISTSAGVFYSTVIGVTWSELSGDLTHKNVFSLSNSETPNSILFAGTKSGGIYYRNMDDILHISPSEIVKNFILHQNYPNPFNTNTTIKYYLDKSSYITLKISNLFGQEVEILANGGKNVGEYEIQWNASRYASGIYFYRLEAGDFAETKKLLLLK